MSVVQKEIELSEFHRGFHIITSIIESELPELKDIEAGVLHVFIKHTSASISLNENADPTVRKDMEGYFNKHVPENETYFLHTMEGDDDMPAHIKASMLGSSVSIPIVKGRLELGTWQGIYLGEHRNHGGRRKLVITLQF